MMITEGEGSSETVERHVEIETNAVCFDNSVIFHVVKTVIGFILYMHQQIPSVLQDITPEFNTLQAEHKELEESLTQMQIKASVRREQLSRKREVKYNIKRFEKLINAINCLETALQLMITEIPCVQDVILVLGANPMRPQHVYELCFRHGYVAERGANDFAKTRAAEVLSRKVVRALISFNSGSDCYLGPTKLFLLVKAPSSFNLPHHFLPKRDFKYRRKILPYRLQLKCRTRDLEFDLLNSTSKTCSSIQSKDSSSNDLIWYQCRHAVKGIMFKTPEED